MIHLIFLNIDYGHSFESEDFYSLLNSICTKELVDYEIVAIGFSGDEETKHSEIPNLYKKYSRVYILNSNMYKTIGTVRNAIS